MHFSRFAESSASRRLPSISNVMFDTLLLAMLAIVTVLTAPFMVAQDRVKFDYRSDYYTWIPDMMVALAPMVVVMALWFIGRPEVHMKPRLTRPQLISIALVLVSSTAIGGLAFVWLMHLKLIGGNWMHWSARWDYLHYGIGQLALFVGFYVSVRITKSARPFFHPVESNYPPEAVLAT